MVIIGFITKLCLFGYMSKRNTQLRRHAISTMVNEQGEVSVEALSAQFETSEVTIRKDLASLEENGQLLRRYGGAIALAKEVVNDEQNTQVAIPNNIF